MSIDKYLMMGNGFWDSLKRPIMALAPMADVTDAAFRRVIAKYGKPDLMYTEFVAIDGLLSDGYDKLSKDLIYTDIERPIVAQIFGTKPENFEKVARMVADMGFDGVDINMGCPHHALVKSGTCGGLIGDIPHAKEIVEATKQGAQSGPNKIPVSLKTRIGRNKIITEEWIGGLLEAHPAAIAIHGRTVKEMSKVPAHWDEIAKAAKLCRDAGVVSLGNGDIKDLRDAREKVSESGTDGAMLGRAIFGNPWLFSEYIPTLQERLSVMLLHAQIYDELFTGIKPFALMRKHFGSYVGGFNGAKELRTKLMEAENSKEVEEMIKPYLEN
ncbi:MAG: tRNA-dihydrouridine synthase [bacterium]|nr:tRNA-dihydrouridine synthase [bacterium]